MEEDCIGSLGPQQTVILEDEEETMKKKKNVSVHDRDLKICQQ
jgi:hypothetical protein